MIEKVIRKAALKALDKVETVKNARERSNVLGVGASGDITLFIDKVAEQTIIEYLKEELESFAILSEEAGYRVCGLNPEYTFIIDPIDGSYNAKRGLALYTISIAVSRGKTFSDIVAGVVVSIDRQFIFEAYKGKGAYLNNIKLDPKGVDTIKGSVIAISAHPRGDFKAFKIASKILHRGGRVRILGSASLEACLVASGIFDAYIEWWNSLRVVDIAAAYIILMEAGCPVKVEGTIGNRDPLISLKERISIFSANSQELFDEINELLLHLED